MIMFAYLRRLQDGRTLALLAALVTFSACLALPAGALADTGNSYEISGGIAEHPVGAKGESFASYAVNEVISAK